MLAIRNSQINAQIVETKRTKNKILFAKQKINLLIICGNDVCFVPSFYEMLYYPRKKVPRFQNAHFFNVEIFLT